MFKDVLYGLEAILKLYCLQIRAMSVYISKNLEWGSVVSYKQQLVAADFWAPLYPYCRGYKPVFESMAANDQHVQFVKINIDQKPHIISKYGIQGIPDVKFPCDGKEDREVVGYISKDNFKKDIEKIVTSAPSCLANLSSVQPSSASNTISILKGGVAE
jgi:thioredoxin-like negative regulator of GroEL